MSKKIHGQMKWMDELVNDTQRDERELFSVWQGLQGELMRRFNFRYQQRMLINPKEEPLFDETCTVCNEPIELSDHNEMFLVEPINKRVWFLNVCSSCQDFGKFDKWLENHHITDKEK